MAIEQIGKYEIDYEAEALPEEAGWAAYVAVYGESDNPAHRKEIIARKRVAVETAFASEADALDQAHKIALTLLE